MFKRFFFLFLALVAILFSGLNNFGRGSPKEHFCEIISKSVQQFQGRCRLKQKLTTYAYSFIWKIILTLPPLGAMIFDFGLSNFHRIPPNSCNFIRKSSGCLLTRSLFFNFLYRGMWKNTPTPPWGHVFNQTA